MSTTLYDLVTNALDRAGDLDNDIWSRSEMELYICDGYDEFCRRTRILYDQWVIENQHVLGNYQTDLERQLASEKPGWSVTDEPFHITAEHEKNNGIGVQYGGSYAGPAVATSQGAIDIYNATTGNTDVEAFMPGGRLPEDTIDLLRVSYDQRTLKGRSSQQMKTDDPNYENRSGDPQWFIYDKYGLFNVRVVPVATGTASYDTVDGQWGTLRQRLDADSAVVDTIADTGTNNWGILRYRDDVHPMGGRDGTLTRVHPSLSNIVCERYRLGRSLHHFAFELPQSYEKYIEYWALSEALNREGPGQDHDMADHYRERFEIGVARAERRKREMNIERLAAFGGDLPYLNFGLGDPQAPYPYGEPF